MPPCTLDSIKYENIVVRHPKRLDSTNLCKVLYIKDKEDAVTASGKLELSITNTTVLSVKTPNPFEMYIQLFFDKNQTRHLRRLENYLVKVAVDNTIEWFSNKINPSLIEEYFVSNLVFDETVGGVIFKCRLEDPYHDILRFKNDRADIVLRAKYLRFTRKNFVIGWSLEGADEARQVARPSDYLFSSDEDDNSETSSERDESTFGDDVADADDVLSPAELKEIATELTSKVELEVERLAQRLEKLTASLKHVQENPTLKNINELHDVFEGEHENS